MNMIIKSFRAGVFGFAVGDALGVPVEFYKRQYLAKNLVKDMLEFGSHKMSKGTWSDDTSMMLCLIESLTYPVDYEKIMQNFERWLFKGHNTPTGKAFGIGKTIFKALSKYKQNIPALSCGSYFARDNGNGSLMRSLPLAFFRPAEELSFEIIHKISKLTHAHPRSLISCSIYVHFARFLCYSGKQEALNLALTKCFQYYKSKMLLSQNVLTHFSRLSHIIDLKEEDIKSSAYVVDTLEAVLWSFLRTKNFEQCVLTAVNLGSDTDTIAALAGGLAGIFYGIDNIPKNWLIALQKRDIIDQVISNSLLGNYL